MNRKNAGFTLIEVVVVLAVVAILAAILTPSIVKSIRDSKIARANNEVQVIGAAMASFYKDVGKWPTKADAPAADNFYYILYGSGTPMAAGGTSAIWSSDGLTWAGEKDTFANHLVRNSPGGTSTPANQYPSTGQFKWNGPYISVVEADPWGTHYSCNVISFWFTGGDYLRYAIYVISAGDNIMADTDYQQLIDIVGDDPEIGGDDIGFRLK